MCESILPEGLSDLLSCPHRKDEGVLQERWRLVQAEQGTRYILLMRKGADISPSGCGKPGASCICLSKEVFSYDLSIPQTKECLHSTHRAIAFGERTGGQHQQGGAQVDLCARASTSFPSGWARLSARCTYL